MLEIIDGKLKLKADDNNWYWIRAYTDEFGNVSPYVEETPAPSGEVGSAEYAVLLSTDDLEYKLVVVIVDGIPTIAVDQTPVDEDSVSEIRLLSSDDLWYYLKAYTSDGITEVGFDQTPITVSTSELSANARIQKSVISTLGSNAHITAAPNDLLFGLQAHWKLNEASGTRVDSHNTHDLTPLGPAIASQTGKLGDAAYFTGTGQRLSVNSSPGFVLGSGKSFTGAGWFYFDTTVAGAHIAGKWQAGSQEWVLYRPGNVPVELHVTADGATSFSCFVSSGVNPPSGTWQFLVWGFDASTGKAFIQANNGTVQQSAATISSVYAGTAPIWLGQAWDTSTANMRGRIDSVSIWNRLLTTDEKTQLYGGGVGYEYDNFQLQSSSNSVTQSANARIQKTISNTLSANARVQKTLTTTESANARVQKSLTTTLAANANIRNSRILTLGANAHIAPLGQNLLNIGANARIQKASVQTLSANARIQRTLSTTSQANARIQRTFSTSLTANSRVQKLLSTSVDANARIQATRSSSIDANARILSNVGLVTVQLTASANARIASRAKRRIKVV